MKIIITGGCGFIGLSLSRELLSDGHDVLLLDNLSVQIHGHLPSIELPDGANFTRLNICDISDNFELLEGSDAIYHLAAETGTAQSMYEMSHYAHVNCEGTTSLLEAIGKCHSPPKHILLASSRSIYGEGAYADPTGRHPFISPKPRSLYSMKSQNWDHLDSSGIRLKPIPTPENFPYSPGSIYAATKAAQELLFSAAGSALGLKVTIFRFQNVYGEGQSLQNPYTGIISIFYNRARQGLSIPVYEDGLESRDFIHISDVVKAMSQALIADLPNNLVLNIGSGQPTSVITLAKTILDASGLDVPIEITAQYRLGDIRNCFADLTLVTKYLDFSPDMPLKDGLHNFCSWASTQPAFKDKTSIAEAELKKRGLSG